MRAAFHWGIEWPPLSFVDEVVVCLARAQANELGRVDYALTIEGNHSLRNAGTRKLNTITQRHPTAGQPVDVMAYVRQVMSFTLGAIV